LTLKRSIHGWLLDELHRGGAELEAAVQRQRDQEADDGADERQPAHGARMLVAPQGKQHGAEQDRRPDGKAQQSHFSSSPS
jgi:hypothetical protein